MPGRVLQGECGESARKKRIVRGIAESSAERPLGLQNKSNGPAHSRPPSSPQHSPALLGDSRFLRPVADGRDCKSIQ